MCWKEFIINILWLASLDSAIAFLLFLVWKYADMKYFSKLEITTLKNENAFLKRENAKINDSSTNFWSEEDMK